MSLVPDVVGCESPGKGEDNTSGVRDLFYFILSQNFSLDLKIIYVIIFKNIETSSVFRRLFLHLRTRVVMISGWESTSRTVLVKFFYDPVSVEILVDLIHFPFLDG